MSDTNDTPIRANATHRPAPVPGSSERRKEGCELGEPDAASAILYAIAVRGKCSVIAKPQRGTRIRRDRIQSRTSCVPDRRRFGRAAGCSLVGTTQRCRGDGGAETRSDRSGSDVALTFAIREG